MLIDDACFLHRDLEEASRQRAFFDDVGVECAEAPGDMADERIREVVHGKAVQLVDVLAAMDACTVVRIGDGSGP